jgi:serine O-acetyltransferase
MAAEFQGFSDFVDMIRGDWIANERSITRPGLQALLVHRLGSWAMALPAIAKIFVVPVYAILYWFVRNVYGIELPRRTLVGRRFCIGHQSGIVIHPFAVIGDDCVIRQNVTIGAAVKVEAPRLGNRVELGAGAVIVGGITIGDDVRIGPNAVVMMNSPANSTVVVPLPRIFRRPMRRPKRSGELRDRGKEMVR